MIALLHRLFTSHSVTPRRPTSVRPPAVLSLERLEDRVTPSTLPAFTGLAIADSHFVRGRRSSRPRSNRRSST